MKSMRSINPSWAIYVAFLVLALITFGTWTIQGRYTVTGDEPHYLVMANGIGRFGTLAQTKPYAYEFRTYWNGTSNLRFRAIEEHECRISDMNYSTICAFWH